MDKVGEDYSGKLISKREEISCYLGKIEDLKHESKELTVKVADLENTTVENSKSNDNILHNLEENREKLNNVKCQVDELVKVRPSSFYIVLDNIDMMLGGSDIASENQHKDIHWCNHNAVIDRVNPTGFSDLQPTADIAEIQNKVFLPTLEDHKALMNDFVVLVARVFVENYDSFHIFRDIVPDHIKHKYSEEMKKATDKVIYI